ncbi:hypothetical protein KPL74_21145 [Bacillus sp. NP157]|nr:hypothetical protein KPL74_21145 [Bacillus sp. NP157]
MDDIFSVSPRFPTYREVVNHHDLVRGAVEVAFCTRDTFEGANDLELSNTRRDTINRLGRQGVISLMACLEASFRVDYLYRAKRKLKDPLSRRLIRVFHRKRRKAALMDDLVKTWLKEGHLSHVEYNRIGTAYEFRHWLAHGEYWLPKRRPNATTFYEIAAIVEGAINCCAFKFDTTTDRRRDRPHEASRP